MGAGSTPVGETDRDLPPWGSWSAGGGRQLANNEYVYVSTSKLCGYVRGLHEAAWL